MAVGFPVGYAESQELGQCPVPRTFIVSTHDEFCAVPAMESYFERLPPPKELIWVEARDHFFSGALEEFEEAVYRAGSSR